MKRFMLLSIAVALTACAVSAANSHDHNQPTQAADMLQAGHELGVVAQSVDHQAVVVEAPVAAEPAMLETLCALEVALPAHVRTQLRGANTPMLVPPGEADGRSFNLSLQRGFARRDVTQASARRV